jgi:AraC-like DNA-binding protein
VPRSVLRTSDPAEAEAGVGQVYVANRLQVLGTEPLDTALDAVRLGSLTVGRLRYGTDSRVVVGGLVDYHLNVPLAGRAVSRAGRGPAVQTTAGTAAVLSPDEPAEVAFLDGCVQLCLMISRETLTAELERLLGRAPGRLRFAPEMDLGGTATCGRLLEVVADALDDETAAAHHPQVARQLERTLVDALLLEQPHDHREQLLAGPPHAAPSPVARARMLLEEQPERPWSVTGLAAEVHVSVRGLQAGFVREYGVPPMTYLRRVRLRRAHDQLVSAEPGTTTVAAVAAGLGFGHLGRFAAAYRAQFGEPPHRTLRDR